MHSVTERPTTLRAAWQYDRLTIYTRDVTKLAAFYRQILMRAAESKVQESGAQ